ncbi:MAG: hypothetical protein LBU73_04150 [Helicobacteraceae bacterium]|jgi:hypothetical protein|nr:hypothetical protein [Helicobacteraceae bacterium]
MKFCFKFLLLSAILCGAMSADAVDDKIRALVDAEKYSQYRSLLDVFFKNREDFMTAGGTANSVKIAEHLKANGLLDIFYKDRRVLQASFRASENPMFFLKAIGESLDRLGYKFTPISKMSWDYSLFEWTLSYKSNHAIDPAALAKELAKYGVTIEDITKQDDSWQYLLSSKNPTVPDAYLLSMSNNKRSPLKIKNIYGEYWIKLPRGASKIYVEKESGSWMVYAVFYDLGLNPLQSAQSKTLVKDFRASIPSSAAYIKITDNDYASALQRGINVWVED